MFENDGALEELLLYRLFVLLKLICFYSIVIYEVFLNNGIKWYSRWREKMCCFNPRHLYQSKEKM